VVRGRRSSHLSEQIEAVNRALEQAFVDNARNSRQKVWFAELRAYWRQLETVLGPHLYDVGLKPEQPVRIEAALMKLTADRDTPFLRP
jgi:glucan biosynthesis protein